MGFSHVALVNRKERGLFVVEIKLYLPGRAVAVLFDEDFGDIWPVAGVLRHFVFAVDEHYDIRVLLYGAGIAQVGKARTATALFHGARGLPRASAGTLSSRARCLSEREISVTCWTMESEARVLVGAISWR